MKTPAKRSSLGFTLIELLVVIAIIALLIGVLLPALSKARRAGKMVKNDANLHGMGQVLTLYSNDYKSWYPVMPVPASFDGKGKFLNGQFLYGGVAGLFSLYQTGDGVRQGYRANGRTFAIADEVTACYSNGNNNPLLRSYISGFGVLVNPLDRQDVYWGYPYVPVPNPPIPTDSAALSIIPKAPGGEKDVISYNISYLYFAGLKTDEPEIIVPAPVWGDETNGPDISTLAFYGGGGSGGSSIYSTWAETRPGTYSKKDNLGQEGGSFVFTDGHVAFLKSQYSDPPAQAATIQNIFFSTDTKRFPQSVNAIRGTRSNLIQTID
jgi:prepilin-type N-terminal cleavage/methylation domain-containing protein